MDRKMGTTDGTLEKIVENTTQNQEQGGKQDVWKLGNHTFTSRFILGSGKYSLELIRAAVFPHDLGLAQEKIRHLLSLERDNYYIQVPAVCQYSNIFLFGGTSPGGLRSASRCSA